jgi:hypothetical protein
MAVVGKYFPGQAPSERVFLVLRRDVFTYVAFMAIAFVMIIPLIILFILYIRFPDTFSNDNVNAGLTLAVSAYLLFILGLLLYGFVDYYLDVYIITDERIVDIKQIGFFKREIAELHLREVQDVSAQVNGIFPTMFHFGDVVIQTAGERENFIFASVPHPYQVSKKIADLHEAQIERERLMTEAGIRDQITDRPAPSEEMDKEKESEPKTSQTDELQLREGEVPGEDIYTHYSKEESLPVEENQSPVDRYFAEKRSPEEEAIQSAETDVNAGLQKIDEYVSETTKANEELEKSIELKEGEVAKIDEEDKFS